jgi:TPR repeat protein
MELKLANRDRWSLQGRFLYDSISRVSGLSSQKTMCWPFFQVSSTTLNNWIHGKISIDPDKLTMAANKLFEDVEPVSRREQCVLEFSNSYRFLENWQNGRHKGDEQIPNMASQYLIDEGHLSKELPKTSESIRVEIETDIQPAVLANKIKEGETGSDGSAERNGEPMTEPFNSSQTSPQNERQSGPHATHKLWIATVSITIIFTAFLSAITLMNLVPNKVQSASTELKLPTNSAPIRVEVVSSDTPLPKENEYTKVWDAERGYDKDAQVSALIDLHESGNLVARAELAVEHTLADGVIKNLEMAEAYGTQAVKGVKRLAGQGDRDALYIYGLMLLHGVSIEKDVPKGREYLVSAKAKGLERASVALAQLDLEADGQGENRCSAFHLAREARKSGFVVGYWLEAEYLYANACPDAMKDRNAANALAITLLQTPAEKDHPGALNLLGVMYREGAGVKEDAEVALNYFRRSASFGNIDAELNIAEMHLLGKVGMDQEKADRVAFQIVDTAAKQGHPQAQYALAWMLVNERGVETASENDGRALQLLRASARAGHIKANRLIGAMYLEDRIHPSAADPTTAAIKWYEIAATQGDVKSQLKLGTLYFEGAGGKSSHKHDLRAFEWFQKASTQGDALATWWVARMHYLGRGISSQKPDFDEALRLFELAVELGSSDAQNHIGFMYTKGHGVVQSDEEALKRYRLAAEAGNKAGLFNMGIVFEKGDGVPKNPAMAYSYFFRSAEKGWLDAMFRVAWYYEHGMAVENNIAKAISYYRQAAMQGHADAQYRLGRLYRGYGGDSYNLWIAFKWFRMASLNGHAKAKIQLAWYYRYGYWRVSQDLDKAISLYEEALDQGEWEASDGLAELYAEFDLGLPPKERRSKVISLYEEAISEGHEFSRIGLAKAYANADLGVPDYARARAQAEALISAEKVNWLSGLFTADKFENYSPIFSEIVVHENEEELYLVTYDDPFPVEELLVDLCYYMSAICDPEHPTSHLPLLEKAAKLGNLDALFWLGIYYELLQECSKASSVSHKLTGAALENRWPALLGVAVIEYKFRICDRPRNFGLVFWLSMKDLLDGDHTGRWVLESAAVDKDPEVADAFNSYLKVIEQRAREDRDPFLACSMSEILMARSSIDPENFDKAIQWVDGSLGTCREPSVVSGIVRKMATLGGDGAVDETIAFLKEFVPLEYARWELENLPVGEFSARDKKVIETELARLNKMQPRVSGTMQRFGPR